MVGPPQAALTSLSTCSSAWRPRGASQHMPPARRLHIVQAKGDDAAKSALSKLFEGKKDILAANERTEDDGDGGDAGDGEGKGGSGGGFNFGAWWQGFHEDMDPYLRFMAAFLVLNLFPVMVDLVGGGWEVVPQIFRLNSSGRQLERLERAQEAEEKKLGQSEKSIVEKYGDGTSDVA